ncbi:Crp/Fnr family transcriptional regulator [Maribellus sp. CM-23]|uniref:Crp/Fnr family transcriptional regulator n=1 Tax=Maribellus sp. CM-23 TaxID=2781026 RepID=UPI001F21F366|nr:Crp/Fnr family transcriptional regulator [Maribellus sp. CM-23]MCE4563801.1 Crp/Fnr family transcriptional regulator [Maribellus sp. CM-23]
MTIKTDACLNCQIKSNVVSILNDEELCELGKGCLQTEFRKGELIFKEGTPAHHVVYIREGFVKLSKKGIGEKDYILSIHKKGAYLALNNLNTRSRQNSVSATAVTPVKVCFIDTEVFGLLLKKNGQFASEVIQYMVSDEMNYFDRLVNNVQQQVPGRLANSLFYFRDQVYNENPFKLDITKQELAALIGTSRESVARLLKEFQEAGIIRVQKNTFTIVEEKKLEEIQRKG